jgi:thioredoxin reductase
MPDTHQTFDCIVIGGGQSALAVAYYLRRAKLNYLLIDKNDVAGGSWTKTWDSLHLFSVAKHNALPGYPMPETEGEYPTKNEVIEYLQQYEDRYGIPVKRGEEVISVQKENDEFILQTDGREYSAKAVVAASGTFSRPYIPNVEGRKLFNGDQIHSSEYRNSKDFVGKRVLVVGAGNSGAQIFAELAQETLCFWGVQSAPEFLPPNIDGKTLFDQASKMYQAKLKGEAPESGVFDLGNIVMVPEVLSAYQSGIMNNFGILDRLLKSEVVWSDGTSEAIDAIVWCTGFGYNTAFLKDVVETDEKGKAETEITKSKAVNGLWLVGYGGWTGMASATIIGVGRTAKRTVKQIEEYIDLL